MRTESETKSAGVPAGATHVCTVCRSFFNGPMILGAEPCKDCCRAGNVRPIAEAGPAPTTDKPPGLTWRADGWPLCPMCGEDELYSLQPKASAAKITGCYRCGWSDPDGLNLAQSPAPTTAAPADLPNRREFYASTPAEFAAAAKVAQGGDTIIVPDWPLPREAAPAAQLSGKVVYTYGPAEQPGKAADPRPAQPWRSPRHNLPLSSILRAAEVAIMRHPVENADTRNLVADLRAADEHFREHPPEVAAPLREERDRLADQINAWQRNVEGEQRACEEAEAERDAEQAKVAERDARIATLSEGLREAIATATKWKSAWAETDRHKAIRLRVEANDETVNLIGNDLYRAALGAPEGQPPQMVVCKNMTDAHDGPHPLDPLLCVEPVPAPSSPEEQLFERS